MKKSLLTAFAGCALCASANATEWTADITGIFDTDGAVYAAQTAVAADGSVIAAGAFNAEATILGNAFEPVGTSAYIAKYNADGTAAWSVALTGAATVTAITTDAEGNIYVAGRYADEVTLGSTDGKTEVVKGIMVWGDYSTDKDASFLARYSATGALTAATSYVPEEIAAAAAAAAANPEGFYFSSRRFIINKLAADGNKVYASAIYAGELKIGEVTFTGTYNDPWDGGFVSDLTATCVFSVNASDFSGCESIITCTTQGNLATENDSYQSSAVSFDVAGGSVYAVFAGNGPLKYTAGADSRVSEAAFATYNYAFVEVKDGKIAQMSEAACPEAGFETAYVPAEVLCDGTTLYAVGYEPFAENYGGENERIGHDIFVFKAAVNNLAGVSKFTKEEMDGDVTYSEVAAATMMSDGNIAVSSLGFYNKKGEGYTSGDFAGVAKTYVYNGTGLVAAAVPGACSVAANGVNIAYQTVSAEGVKINADIDTAGVEGIIADGTDAPVEYYNLQGIRIASPESGVVIRRQGNQVQKVTVK